jgi:hypothetical protein
MADRGGLPLISIITVHPLISLSYTRFLRPGLRLYRAVRNSGRTWNLADGARVWHNALFDLIVTWPEHVG